MDSLDGRFTDDSLAILLLPEPPTINPSMTFIDSQDQNYTQMQVTDKNVLSVAESHDYLDLFSFPATSDEQLLQNTWLPDMGGLSTPLDDRLPFTRSNSEPASEKTVPRKARRRIDEEEWNGRKTFILQLYKTTTLDKLVQTMEKDHNFPASKSAFKEHFRDWSAPKKNLPKEYAVYALKKMKQRMEVEGKSTSFRYCGKPVPLAKIKRAKVDHNDTISIRSTTPSNLSIITPRDSSCDHPDSRKRSIEEDHLNIAIVPQNLPRKKERLVDIHQEDLHASVSDTVPPTGISLKERLDMHAYTQRILYEELSVMSSADLCELFVGSETRKHLWGNELVLENIIVKSEGSLQMDVGSSRSKIDTSRYKIAYVKALISQRRFFTAGMVLEGLQVQRDRLATTAHLRLQILKLALLIDIDDNIQEPRSLDLIEAKCLSLIAEQGITLFKNDGCWPENLVLAYLFRLHGVHERPLQYSTVQKMQRVLDGQFAAREKPSRSLIWAAHQYIRWCLRDMKYDEAGRALENAARVVKTLTGPGSPEAIATDALLSIQAQYRCDHEQSPTTTTRPELVEVYSRTAVDVQWEKAFRDYLLNEPCPDMSYSYPARSKDLDKDYWH